MLKQFKQISCYLSVLIFAFSLAACGGGGDGTTPPPGGGSGGGTTVSDNETFDNAKFGTATFK